MHQIRNCQTTKTERRIIAAIRKMNGQYRSIGSKTSKWTRALKNAVGKVGDELGYDVYGAGCKYWRNGEWMFDLAWVQGNGNYSLRLPLIMESEFNRQELLEDFLKLVVSKADLRIMVFWESTQQRGKSKISEMLKQARLFSKTDIGDRYLFCYWADCPEGLFFESYRVCKKAGNSMTS